MRILLLRHAETDWNRERRFQGWRDVPLSATGREQAESAARLLAATRIDAVWSSPLARAVRRVEVHKQVPAAEPDRACRQCAGSLPGVHGGEAITPQRHQAVPQTITMNLHGTGPLDT